MADERWGLLRGHRFLSAEVYSVYGICMPATREVLSTCTYSAVHRAARTLPRARPRDSATHIAQYQRRYEKRKIMGEANFNAAASAKSGNGLDTLLVTCSHDSLRKPRTHPLRGADTMGRPSPKKYADLSRPWLKLCPTRALHALKMMRERRMPLGTPYAALY